MKRNRIIWACIVITLAIISMFSKQITGICLLCGSILFPLVSVLYSRFTSKQIIAQVELPSSVNKNKSIEGIICVNTVGKSPIFKAVLCLSIRNIRTGEVQKCNVSTGFTGKQQEEIPFKMESRFCGCVYVTIDSMVVYDALGLWKKEIEVNCGNKVHVVPDTFDMMIRLQTSHRSSSDSVEYASDRAGYDVSEIFGIREYIPGDSIKNIHWKLTSKCEELMVKLPSLPVENSILLLLNNGFDEECETEAHTIDALTEAFLTMSQTLLNNSISHRVAWYEYAEQKMFVFDIESEEDFHSMMGRLLDAKMEADVEYVWTRYKDYRDFVEKAHIVYFGTSFNGELEDVAADIVTSAVVFGNSLYSDSGPTTMYVCDWQNYVKELSKINI